MTDLRERYLNIRKLTEKYCEPLNIEDYIPQVEEYASPPGWHIAHTSWFFEEMILKKHVDSYIIYDEKFSYLFNSYYESVGERNSRNQRGAITRPGVAEIYDYRKYVDTHMIAFIIQNNEEEVEQLIDLGLNHEQQHQELLLTDLKLALSYNPLDPIYDASLKENNTKKDQNEWIKIPEGIYQIGHHNSDFCYDNELGTHKVYLQHYQISSQLITNKEYLEFINSGGYNNAEY